MITDPNSAALMDRRWRPFRDRLFELVKARSSERARLCRKMFQLGRPWLTTQLGSPRIACCIQIEAIVEPRAVLIAPSRERCRVTFLCYH